VPAIAFLDAAERRFIRAEESAPKEAVDQMSEAERAVELFMRHPGSAHEPQLLEVRFPPGTASRPHAHEEDEIIVVLEGEARFGARVLGPGSSVFIPAMTLYAFTAGTVGVRFLSFRPRRDDSVIGKAELLARSRARSDREHRLPAASPDERGAQVEVERFGILLAVHQGRRVMAKVLARERES
jgi:quercetin dioxygenase-like cupin family protein